MELSLRAIGNSVGVVLPKEILAHMKVQKGGKLFCIETSEGVLLTPYDPQVEQQLEAGRAFMSEYRDTFRALSKA